jgi:GNAT superfamily N-acetyltransferase
MQQPQFRRATADDTDVMYSVLMEYGTNEWNYLPEADVAAELKDVAEGKAFALLAELDTSIIGFAIAYPRFIRFPEHTDPNISEAAVGYIGDVVVHKEYAGKGIGTVLLEEVKKAFLKYGVFEIYIDCHEENKASRGMMRKACFEELTRYLDPKRRTTGTRKSWVGHCSLQKSV